VRKALNYAVDRKGMLGTILPKESQLAAQMVMPSIPGHNYELDKEQYNYDPEKAKLLLAQARADGVPVDRQIDLIGYAAEFPNEDEYIQAVYKMYKDVGLNVKLSNMAPGPYHKMNDRPYPEDRGPTLLQSSHDNNSGDPVFSVSFKYGCGGATSMYCNPALDKEIAQASTLGGAERVAAWKKIFAELYKDDVPSVWMYHMVGFTRVNPRIDFVPDVTTNAELHVQNIHFTKNSTANKK
jgi:peptide/nickel transport system substrate-binding protein